MSSLGSAYLLKNEWIRTSKPFSSNIKNEAALENRVDEKQIFDVLKNNIFPSCSTNGCLTTSLVGVVKEKNSAWSIIIEKESLPSLSVLHFTSWWTTNSELKTVFQMKNFNILKKTYLNLLDRLNIWVILISLRKEII